MRIHLSRRGQNVIEYILLVTAVIVVVITGILAKNPQGTSFFGNTLDRSIDVTSNFVAKRDASMEFQTYDERGGLVPISRQVATGHN